jgi:uncharacterized membrane protein YebE (DUF533 family)
MKYLVDYTKSNFESLFEDRKLKNNIPQRESILQDEDFKKQTKRDLLLQEIRNLDSESKEFDVMLEEIIFLTTSDDPIDEDERKTIKEKVKTDVQNYYHLEEEKKAPFSSNSKYDRFASRTVLSQEIKKYIK